MVGIAGLAGLEKLEAQLKSSYDRGGGGGFNDPRRYLQLLRKHQLRRSELAVRYGRPLIEKRSWRAQLGEELWTIYEQVGIAALDCGDLLLAQACGNALVRQFPNSVRAGRLEGLLLESQEEWEEAEKVYAALLEEAPSNSLLLKRQVAVQKGKGNLAGAVELLNKYLDTFQADSDAWRELGDIYLSLQAYKQAAFCYEELILAQPNNALFHLTYAELLYTMGGLDNLRLSRKYYAAAVELTGGKDMRALYGLCLAAVALVTSKGGKRGEESTSIVELAAESIEKEYKEKCPQKLELVKKVLQRQLAVL